MITKLTKKQEDGIIEWREHCLKIGRDTSPINKELTETSWNKFYKMLGKKEPTFWYCQSPLQAQVVINLLQQRFFKDIFNLRNNIRNNISNNINDNIRNNIWNNISNNISNNINDNIRNNINDNIRNNIGNNISNNIRDNINDNISNNISNDIRSKIRSKIRSNIWDNIRNNISDNISDNIRNNIKETKFNYIETYSWCQHDINWVAYYKYYEKYGLLPYDRNFEIFNIWYDLACSCGWCYTFENIVFVCEKPCELHINDEGMLHKDGGMVLKYSDGYGIYMLNGVKVPEYLAVTPEANLELDFFKKEKNVDVKAEFIRKYGISRMKDMGKKVDSYKNYSHDEWWVKSEYELIDMSTLFTSVKYAPHLLMRNQTIKELYHLEGVGPECKTLDQAIKWRENTKNESYKTISIK